MNKMKMIHPEKFADRIKYFAKRLEEWNLKEQAETAKTIAKGIKLEKTMDVVEAKKYDELRKLFIDYVHSGTINAAPYCKNSCDECVDEHGQCMLQSKECRGFNPDEK